MYLIWYRYTINQFIKNNHTSEIFLCQIVNVNVRDNVMLNKCNLKEIDINNS